MPSSARGETRRVSATSRSVRSLQLADWSGWPRSMDSSRFRTSRRTRLSPSRRKACFAATGPTSASPGASATPHTGCGRVWANSSRSTAYRSRSRRWAATRRWSTASSACNRSRSPTACSPDATRPRCACWSGATRTLPRPRRGAAPRDQAAGPEHYVRAIRPTPRLEPKRRGRLDPGVEAVGRTARRAVSAAERTTRPDALRAAAGEEALAPAERRWRLRHLRAAEETAVRAAAPGRAPHPGDRGGPAARGAPAASGLAARSGGGRGVGPRRVEARAGRQSARRVL